MSQSTIYLNKIRQYIIVRIFLKCTTNTTYLLILLAYYKVFNVRCWQGTNLILDILRIPSVSFPSFKGNYSVNTRWFTVSGFNKNSWTLGQKWFIASFLILPIKHFGKLYLNHRIVSEFRSLIFVCSYTFLRSM